MRSLAEKAHSEWMTSTLNLCHRHKNLGESSRPSSSFRGRHFPGNPGAFEIGIADGVGDVDEVANLDSFGALHP
jgi:hypothetical protein